MRGRWHVCVHLCTPLGLGYDQTQHLWDKPCILPETNMLMFEFWPPNAFQSRKLRV